MAASMLLNKSDHKQCMVPTLAERGTVVISGPESMKSLRGILVLGDCILSICTIQILLLNKMKPFLSAIHTSDLKIFPKVLDRFLFRIHFHAGFSSTLLILFMFILTQSCFGLAKKIVDQHCRTGRVKHIGRKGGHRTCTKYSSLSDQWLSRICQLHIASKEKSRQTFMLPFWFIQFKSMYFFLPQTDQFTLKKKYLYKKHWLFRLMHELNFQMSAIGGKRLNSVWILIYIAFNQHAWMKNQANCSSHLLVCQNITLEIYILCTHIHLQIGHQKIWLKKTEGFGLSFYKVNLLCFFPQVLLLLNMYMLELANTLKYILCIPVISSGRTIVGHAQGWEDFPAVPSAEVTLAITSTVNIVSLLVLN